jgi:hypothetical protein
VQITFTLEELLNYPVTLELLKDEMSARHTIDSLAFWIDAQLYKSYAKGALCSLLFYALLTRFLTS